MTRALMTGVSGLRAHQNQLDVVANNLANMNTLGFKAQSTTFADLVYHSISSGSGPGENGNSGGTNPQQIGAGVRLGQIARRFQQGSLEATGEHLDFAIQGDGFFVLEGPAGNQAYSRAGSFSIDAAGYLVDPSSGYQVQRTSGFGEATETTSGFQELGNNNIRVPLGTAVSGGQTTEVNFFGNLPSSAGPPRNEVLTSADIFSTNTAVADSTTLLNDITFNDTDYVAGDELEISGTNPDGTPFSTSIDAESATMGDLVTGINSVLVGASAELNDDGRIEITADESGEAFLSLSIRDADGNVGDTNFSRAAMVVSTDGHDGDQFSVSQDVFDKSGGSHRVEFAFRKTSNNSWEVNAELTDGSGVFVDRQVADIIFNEDGTYTIAGGDGDGDTNVEINFDLIEEIQPITLTLNNLTHLSTDYSVSLSQDGSPPGTLTSVTVDGNGAISGLASNGKLVPLAQMAIARFANRDGLESTGGNFFQATRSSGEAIVGSGLTEGRGQVVGNQLENSNVEVAQEFTRLIVAQRGFSANARSITVASEVLEELTNIVR